MVNMKTIRAGIAELPKGPPLVVAISGGTTGIGSYIAKAFATTFARDGTKLRVYIIGRNATRAESVMTEGRSLSPGSDWKFIKASDLSLISEVDKACADLIKQETESPFAGGPPRLDLLYMTHSSSPLVGKSIVTSEGLDTFFSTLYYSRIRIINKLTPLLQASPNQSHVISVYAGSMEEVKAGQEPPLGAPKGEEYGINTVRRNVVFMKNWIFQKLATENAGKISFTHIYPGLVDGPGFYNAENPTWFKIVWRIMYPLLWLTYMTQPDTCGQVMAYLATPAFPAKGTPEKSGVTHTVGTDGEKGSGFYAVGQRCDPGNKQGAKAFAAFQGKGLEDKTWNHTMELFETIEKQNAQK